MSRCRRECAPNPAHSCQQLTAHTNGAHALYLPRVHMAQFVRAVNGLEVTPTRLPAYRFLPQVAPMWHPRGTRVLPLSLTLSLAGFPVRRVTRCFDCRCGCWTGICPLASSWCRQLACTLSTPCACCPRMKYAASRVRVDVHLVMRTSTSSCCISVAYPSVPSWGCARVLPCCGCTGMAALPRLRDSLIDAVKEAARSAWRTAWRQFVKRAVAGSLPVGRSTDSPRLLQLAAVSTKPWCGAHVVPPTPPAPPSSLSLPTAP